MDSLIKNYFSFLPKSSIKAGEGIENGEYPFFTSSDIKVSSLNTYSVDDEILVIGTGGKASCNYYCGKCSYSTDNFALKSSGDVLSKFLYYFLRKDNLKVLENGFHGAGLKHISKDYFANIRFPLLKMEKQKEIVETLDAISSAKEKCSENISKLDDLVKSRFIN